MTILHIIAHDKFTLGYISFMQKYYSECEQLFLASKDSICSSVNVIDELKENSSVVVYSDWKWLAFSNAIKKYIDESDIIIVSGLFGFEHSIFFWPSKALNKTYIQYWGGDFYQLREKLKFWDLFKKIDRFKLLRVMDKTYGAVFLIEDDYVSFKSLTGFEKKNVYTAAMPFDPNTTYNFSEHRNHNMTCDVNVVVGNSAAIDNEHCEAFEKLKHLKQHVSVYCPLSYGDDEYREMVISLGNKYFGDKFHPVLDWMDEKDYYDFLSTMDIGIFGNNRQQGMGNIRALLSMGKKVFLRTNTSMYMYYSRIGFKCYDYESLNVCEYDDLICFPEQETNERIADTWYTPESVKTQWDKVIYGG